MTSATQTDGDPPKRARNAQATRQAILDAATNEFAEHGLSGASVRDIAARTASSKHMIYYHFQSKEGLYSAVLERAYHEFRLVEGAVDYGALSPEAALAELVGATFDIHATHPAFVRIVMGENINRGEHIREIEDFRPRGLALETLREILARGEGDGSFVNGLDPLQIHLSISALSFHYIANVHTFGHVFAIEAHADDALRARREEVVETILRRCVAR